ncbi:MAG: Rap1a/Tai family immunity protein [Pseudomonadales bacterium]|nr:hypothetical protein [Pseudomonadales bacterium]
MGYARFASAGPASLLAACPQATFLLRPLLLVPLLLAPEAYAVPPLLASEFARDCAIREDGQAATERCELYISGFLDGAVATDERVAQNVAKELERKETFTERALRTRVGERILRHGPSVYAEYCIGEPVPVAEVIELLQREISEKPPEQDDLARDTMYTLLRKHYPCSE